MDRLLKKNSPELDRYDHEDYFDYKGAIVDISFSTSRQPSTLPPLTRSSIEIDFALLTGRYSNLTCASKPALESHWSLGRCKTLVFPNVTKCVCSPVGGMYSLVARGPDDQEVRDRKILLTIEKTFG